MEGDVDMPRCGSIRRLLPALAALFALAACQPTATAQTSIPFAPMVDTSLKDPDNSTKVFRIDFARVEHEYPLSRQHRLLLTPENIKQFTQEQIDQIYARLTAGPIPDGPYQGDLFFERGESLGPRLAEIVGGLEGRVVGLKVQALERLGRVLWKGKMFYRDERVLRNFIADALLLRPLVDDVSTVMKAEVPRTGPLRRLVPTDEVWLLFPAKLYCGQSLLDSRRESVIIDYHYADEIPGYRASPDSLASRGGLRIRDEIRMVRPGFYLGRAYANKMFLLNFILYSPEIAERAAGDFVSGADVREDCWSGEQIRRADAR